MELREVAVRFGRAALPLPLRCDIAIDNQRLKLVNDHVQHAFPDFSFSQEEALCWIFYDRPLKDHMLKYYRSALSKYQG